MSTSTTLVQLDSEAAQVGEIDEKTMAEIRSKDADTKVRIWMATAIMLLFIVLNASVIFLVCVAFKADLWLIQNKLIQSDQRLITEKVFMSLIGATVVQVGVTLVSITGYLFPKKNDG